MFSRTSQQALEEIEEYNATTIDNEIDLDNLPALAAELQTYELEKIKEEKRYNQISMLDNDDKLIDVNQIEMEEVEIKDYFTEQTYQSEKDIEEKIW